MARIICVNGGLHAPLNGTLEVINRLKKSGHEVISASPTDISASVSSLGVPFVKLDDWTPVFGNQVEGSWWSRIRNRRKRRSTALEELGVRNFSQTISDLEPDLVLIEIEMREHIAEALSAGIKIATISPFASIWRQPGIPPISSSTIPGNGFWGTRFGTAALWNLTGLHNWARLIYHRFRTVGLDRQSILKLHAKNLGLRFVPEYGFHLSLVPDRRDDIPVLCLHAEEFNFRHDPPVGVHYTGHMVVRDRVEPRVSLSEIRRLTAIISQSKAQNSPLIYFGSSTFAPDNQARMKRIIEAAQNRPNWQFVFGLGSNRDLMNSVRDAPPNVHLFSYVPQTQVLKVADCAVIDAGIMTITECLEFQVPMLLYSLGHACQNGSAARVLFHKLGHVGDREKDSPNAIFEEVEVLMADEAMKKRQADYNAKVAYYRSENRVVKIVEDLISE
ncbi:MAG: glycosyltransferase [Paracoccaceae bacterium]